MTKAERRARFEVAIEVADTVYKDMCRDWDVPKEQVRKFCDLIIQMNEFKCSLDPRPYDHEENHITEPLDGKIESAEQRNVISPTNVSVKENER